MKKTVTACMLLIVASVFVGCDDRPDNSTAKDEQAHTEMNQRTLLEKQPPPNITWSLERDNLIKRFKLMNDRSVMFYMYLFIEGSANPIGYYQVNKVSSVDSQLTNPLQLVNDPHGSLDAGSAVVPSPAEDGSYGTNGQGVFGFTPEDVYIEHNMKYIVSTIPLNFPSATRLVILNASSEAQLKTIMDKIK
jgi:hypothetical protein